MKVLTKDMIKNLDYKNNEYFFSSVTNFNGLNIGDMFLGILINYEKLINIKKNKKIILFTHKTLENICHLFFDIFDDFYHIDLEILKEYSDNDISIYGKWPYNKRLLQIHSKIKTLLNATELHYNHAGRVYKILNTPILKNELVRIKSNILPKIKLIKEKNKDKILPSNSILVCMDRSDLRLIENQNFVLNKLNEKYNYDNIFIRKLKDANCIPNINNKGYKVYNENIFYLLISCMLDSSIKIISIRNGLMDILNLFSENPLLIIYPTDRVWSYTKQKFDNINTKYKVLYYYEDEDISLLDKQLDLI